jgi:hypothetical protein
VTNVLVEHAPPRAKKSWGDKSAFDAYLKAQTPGEPVFMGAETKYTEALSARRTPTRRYRLPLSGR